MPVNKNNMPIINYVAYDIETTGLSPYRDKIIEIGAVKVIDNEVVKIFQELINPLIKIPADATKVNGITNTMVKDCRYIEDVLPDFIDFTGDLPLVAHNADFDYSFIKNKWFELTGGMLNKEHYCTMKQYRSYYKSNYRVPPTSARLDDVYRTLCGEPITDHHRALSDAMAVMKIFKIISGE